MRLTMKARQEVTKTTAGQYRGAGKKEKSRILDQFVSALVKLWRIMDHICGKRLQPLLPELIHILALLLIIFTYYTVVFSPFYLPFCMVHFGLQCYALRFSVIPCASAIKWHIFRHSDYSVQPPCREFDLLL